MNHADQPLCACGSFLSAMCCCQMDLSSLSGLAPAPADLPLFAQAMEAERQGADVLAQSLCREILERWPAHAGALWLLSRLCADNNRSAAAEALVRRIVTLNPNDAKATQDLALRILRRKGALEAEAHARNAVRAAPLDPQSHVVMGMVLTEALKPHAAETHYRRALVLSGKRDPIVLANFALCLRMQGRLAEGRALYEDAQEAAPVEFQILLDWAKLEESDGQFARAAELLGRAAQLRPKHASLRLLRAVLQARQGETNTALATLHVATGMAPLTAEEMLERGRLLDRAGQHDAAFSAFEAARAAMLAQGKPHYAHIAAAQLVARLRSFFTTSRLATLPRASVRTDRPQPVFILGFPRSGTTLVEQTLTATQAISAGGELPLIWEVTHAMPRLLDSPLLYPEALAELWMGDRSEGLESLRDHYLQRAQQFGVPCTPALFTDKMPLNEMHLGLIGLTFPTAPLIHVMRHPLDVVLSVYSNNLTHGFNCAASLDSAARHYVLIADLVAHYRAQMELNYLAIRYEDLVRDHENQVRRMLDFIGVACEPAHLKFHENRRHAPTASYAQVTEPLYDRSVERWRHYRAQLAPVIPMLRPAIERMGYDCD